MDHALSVKNVYKCIGDFELSDINFDIRRGEVMLLGGKNGSGKTKLMETISCISTPSKGRIKYFDNTVYDGKIKKKNLKHANRRLGILLQDERLWDSLTVRETFDTFSTLYGTEDPERYYSKCPLIKDELNKKVGVLSDGKKQLIKFLLSIGHNPDIIFLDEPSSFLDDRVRRWILNKIKRLKSAGTSFLISINLLWEVGEIADRMMIIEDGQIKNIIDDFHDYYNGNLLVSDNVLNNTPDCLSVEPGHNTIITKDGLDIAVLGIGKDDLLEVRRPALGDFYRVKGRDR